MAPSTCMKKAKQRDGKAAMAVVLWDLAVVLWVLVAKEMHGASTWVVAMMTVVGMDMAKVMDMQRAWMLTMAGAARVTGAKAIGAKQRRAKEKETLRPREMGKMLRELLISEGPRSLKKYLWVAFRRQRIHQILVITLRRTLDLSRM